jgi:hypothetical protein
VFFGVFGAPLQWGHPFGALAGWMLASRHYCVQSMSQAATCLRANLPSIRLPEVCVLYNFWQTIDILSFSLKERTMHSDECVGCIASLLSRCL